MSLLQNTSANLNSSSSKRSYISTTPFNTSIYSYRTRLNATAFKNEGKLSLVSTLPSGEALSTTNCPAGRILRETGRKLYPGANPGLEVGDVYNGATVGTAATQHLWVYVYDIVTGLSGYIDPNNTVFTVYNSDRNNAFVDLGEQTGGMPTRLGQPVYTGGNVIANGIISAGISVYASTNIVAGTSMSASTTMEAATRIIAGTSISAGTNISSGTFMTAGSSISASTNIVAGTFMTAGTSISAGTNISSGTIITAGTSMTAATTMTAQKYLTLPVGSGTGSVGSPLTASSGSANFNGGNPGYQRVYTTQATGSSAVFITVNNATARAATAVPGSGFIDVYSSVNGDASTFYWLIIN